MLWILFGPEDGADETELDVDPVAAGTATASPETDPEATQ